MFTPWHALIKVSNILHTVYLHLYKMPYTNACWIHALNSMPRDQHIFLCSVQCVCVRKMPLSSYHLHLFWLHSAQLYAFAIYFFLQIKKMNWILCLGPSSFFFFFFVDSKSYVFSVTSESDIFHFFNTEKYSVQQRKKFQLSHVLILRSFLARPTCRITMCKQ